jgi:3-hydroxybutyryl-CoA dehydrogenase
MSCGIDAVDSVGVVGAGTMGSGIAQVSALAGYDLVMRDIEPALVEDRFDAIEDSLGRFVDRGALTEKEAAAVTDRITGTTALADLADCDLVVEAAVEDMDVKREVFADLADLTAPGTVLATNTSTLSVTTIASATDRPEEVVGLHFMKPVPVMEGVEVVVGEKTARGSSSSPTPSRRRWARPPGRPTTSPASSPTAF